MIIDHSHHLFPRQFYFQRVSAAFLFQLHFVSKRLRQVLVRQSSFHFPCGTHSTIFQQQRVGEGGHDFFHVMGDENQGGGFGLAGEAV